MILFVFFFLFTEIQAPDPSRYKCRCGKQSKYKNETSKTFCDPNDNRCPCAADNLPCVFCQCYNCQNKPVAGTPLSCKCNSSRKESVKEACKNKVRASCCCAKAGLACTSNCFCYNCCNGKPQEEQPEHISEGESPRKRIRKGFKLKSGGIKDESNDALPTQEWTEQELICLMVCKEVLAACNVEQNVHNISQVFSYIAKSKNNSDLGLWISAKKEVEIQDRLLQFLHVQNPVVTQLVTMTTSTMTV